MSKIFAKVLENCPFEAYGAIATDCVEARLKLSKSYSIVALVCTVLMLRYYKRRGLKEKSDAQGPGPGSNLSLFCGSLQ